MTARGFLLVSFLFAQLVLGRYWWPYPQTTGTGNLRVTVRNGTFEGLHSPVFKHDFFLGVPYAQDTGGPNRFRVPQPLNTTWSDIRGAKQYSHACPGDTVDGDDEYGISENCLSINIVCPTGS